MSIDYIARSLSLFTTLSLSRTFTLFRLGTSIFNYTFLLFFLLAPTSPSPTQLDRSHLNLLLLEWWDKVTTSKRRLFRWVIRNLRVWVCVCVQVVPQVDDDEQICVQHFRPEVGRQKITRSDRLYEMGVCQYCKSNGKVPAAAAAKNNKNFSAFGLLARRTPTRSYTSRRNAGWQPDNGSVYGTIIEGTVIIHFCQNRDYCPLDRCCPNAFSETCFSLKLFLILDAVVKPSPNNNM